jgi:hypothetical protein
MLYFSIVSSTCHQWSESLNTKSNNQKTHHIIESINRSLVCCLSSNSLHKLAMLAFNRHHMLHPATVPVLAQFQYIWPPLMQDFNSPEAYSRLPNRKPKVRHAQDQFLESFLLHWQKEELVLLAFTASRAAMITSMKSGPWDLVLISSFTEGVVSGIECLPGKSCLDTKLGILLFRLLHAMKRPPSSSLP